MTSMMDTGRRRGHGVWRALCARGGRAQASCLRRCAGAWLAMRWGVAPMVDLAGVGIMGVMVPSKATFSRDLGLQLRMLLTMALLGLLYVVFIVVLLAAGVGTALMLLIVARFALAQLFLSDKLALRTIGAREVSPSEAPDLHAIIDRAGRPAQPADRDC